MKSSYKPVIYMDFKCMFQILEILLLQVLGNSTEAIFFCKDHKPFPVLNNAVTIGDFYVLAVEVVKSGKVE